MNTADLTFITSNLSSSYYAATNFFNSNFMNPTRPSNFNLSNFVSELNSGSQAVEDVSSLEDEILNTNSIVNVFQKSKEISRSSESSLASLQLKDSVLLFSENSIKVLAEKFPLDNSNLFHIVGPAVNAEKMLFDVIETIPFNGESASNFLNMQNEGIRDLTENALNLLNSSDTPYDILDEKSETVYQ